MLLLIIRKIILIYFVNVVTHSATSNSTPDSPDVRTFISNLGRVSDGQLLSADEKLELQSFILNQYYAGKIAQLLMSHVLSLLPPPVANPVAKSSSSQIEGTIIPLENRTNTFENFYTRTPYAVKVQQLTKSFVDRTLSNEKSQLMYWSGSSGKGKTHLAVSVAKTLAHAGKKVLFLSGSKMHEHFQGIPRTTSSLSSEQYFGKYDMVIVDALNSIDCTQRMYLRGLLLDIAFDRGGLKVIITSNMDVNSFIENLSFESSSKSKSDAHYCSTRI